MQFERRSAFGLSLPDPARIALGYACLPSTPQGDAVALRAQTLAIARACAARRLELEQVMCDVDSARGDELGRPGLQRALERIAGGEAGSLVVAGLNRLALSAASVGALIEWLADNRGRLIAADLDLDTSRPEARVAAQALVAVGDLQRQKLREGTLKGLEAARAQGAVAGRPAVADRPELRERIARLRSDGMTLQAIADLLNEEGVPTLRGGAQWRPSSVHAATGYRRPPRRHGLARLPGRRTPRRGDLSA